MQTLIAANWKMHKNRSEAKNMVEKLISMPEGIPHQRDIVIFPPFLAIEATKKELEHSDIAIGAQNFYPAPSGAFTGEISLDMLKDVGCTWILVGHSERRHIIGEQSTLIAQKTNFALSHGFSVILCVGETEQEQEAGLLNNVLERQLTTAIADIPLNITSQLVIAYEPVWAIGTGKVASHKDIVTAHTLIRERLHNILGYSSQNIRILYGGSVNPENASSILVLDNVNGLLVGGASLQAKSFIKIIQAGLIKE